MTETGAFGAPATACVRGATAQDTPIYLAGIRLNDDVGGTTDLSMIPLYMIDRIEIYRGNAPLAADRLGPGGAIFFEPRLPQKLTVRTGYQGGSWGSSRYFASAGDRARSTSYLVGLSAERASNRYPFLDDHGMTLSGVRGTPELRRNADERTVDGWLLARTKLGRGFVLDSTASAALREQGVPRLALLQSQAARQTTARALIALGLKGPLDSAGDAELELRTSYLLGDVSYDDPLRELALQTTSLNVRSHRIEQLIAARLAPSTRLRLRPVLNLAYENIDRSPSDIPLGSSSRTAARLGTNAEYDLLESVTANALITAECHHTDSRGRGYCDELFPTGRVGGSFRSGALTWLASAGRYLRVPTLGELYGVSGTVHGNQSLEPETGTTLDAGVRAAFFPGKVWSKLYLDVFFYQRNAQNLVAYARTGQGFIRPYNVGAARVRGAELLLGSRFFEFAVAEFSATLLDPKDVSPGRTIVNQVLPYRSRLIASPRVRFEYARAARRGLTQMSGQVAAVYQSNRYADPAGLAVIEPQLTVDVDGALDFYRGLLTVRGRIVDLFDQKRTDVIGYPLPGRSFHFGLESQY